MKLLVPMMLIVIAATATVSAVANFDAAAMPPRFFPPRNFPVFTLATAALSPTRWLLTITVLGMLADHGPLAAAADMPDNNGDLANLGDGATLQGGRDDGPVFKKAGKSEAKISLKAPHARELERKHG